MTDLTPDDILRVARAVRPEWTDDMGYWVVEPNGAAEFRMHHSGNGGFDPLNSNADAFKVMAWLQSIARVKFVHQQTIFLSTLNDAFDHDGTEAGLRGAITQAAARVA